MRKAYDQKERDKEAQDRRARPISIMSRWQCPGKPLCLGVCRGVLRWEMWVIDKNVLRPVYSPLPIVRVVGSNSCLK